MMIPVGEGRREYFPTGNWVSDIVSRGGFIFRQVMLNEFHVFIEIVGSPFWVVQSFGKGPSRGRRDVSVTKAAKFNGLTHPFPIQPNSLPSTNWKS